MGLAWLIFRYTVFGFVALAALAALGVMMVQRRQLNPFGSAARTIRRITDPVLKPIERRILRSGGNPQSAPWWMLGLSVIAGILLISFAEWGIRQATLVQMAAHGGARSVAHMVASWAFSLIGLALFVRVIGSWLGASRYTWWMRPFFLLTEWFLAPLRRIIPPFGPIDLSPLVAWFLLSYVLRPLILGLF